MKKIMILLMSLLIVLSAASCTKKETPEEVVENGLSAVASLNLLKMQKYFEAEVDSESDNIFESDLKEDIKNIKLLVDKLEFEVISAEIDDDQAIVQTKITNIDMGVIMQKYIAQAFVLALGSLGSDDEALEVKMEALFIDLLQEEDVKTTTNIVNITLKKNNNKWKIQMDNELLNGIFGGFFNATDAFDE